jgi:3-isopropylmalate/(R)-2-methylmalate dehydratase large subunit
MHAIEKIMAKASQNAGVITGQIVEMAIDKAMLHDRGGPKVLGMLKEHNLLGKPVVRPENILAYFDHDVPSTKLNSALRQKEWRDFCAEKGITHLYEGGTGVSHVLMFEQGHVTPGQVIVGTDSHTCTGGAFGAVAAGVGETEMTAVLMTGSLWFKVPNIIKIEINGAPQPYVKAKDVMLRLLQQLGTGSYIYSAVEFCGSYIDALDMEERSVVASMSVELGMKFGYIQPDGKTLTYIQNVAPHAEFEVFATDADFQYKDTLVINVDNLPLLIAPPHNFDHIIEAKDALKVKIDQAVIGSCTGGLLDDLRITAEILKGKTVPSYVRLIVTPASRDIYLEALKRGYVEAIVQAGGIFNPARCGPCGSSHDGLLGPGEVCITNANRNFKGRLGSPEASIYLASTATVAASAACGYVTCSI